MINYIDIDSTATVRVRRECSRCEGYGYTMGCRHTSEGPDDREIRCDECDGRGYTMERESLVDLIEADLGEYTHTDGQVYRFAEDEDEDEDEEDES